MTLSCDSAFPDAIVRSAAPEAGTEIAIIKASTRT